MGIQFRGVVRVVGMNMAVRRDLYTPIGSQLGSYVRKNNAVQCSAGNVKEGVKNNP